MPDGLAAGLNDEDGRDAENQDRQQPPPLTIQAGDERVIAGLETGEQHESQNGKSTAGHSSSYQVECFARCSWLGRPDAGIVGLKFVIGQTETPVRQQKSRGAMMRVWAALVLVFCALAPGFASAQSFSAFGPRPSPELVVPAFTDAEVTTLVATLDRLLAAESSPADWPQRAPDILWQFARRLQSGRLTPAQEATVLGHVDRLAAAHPSGREIVGGARRMVTELMVGKKAPDITGTDLDGRTFKLSDYRNKVVVLVFSAEWCGICKTQVPYEKFLADQYGQWPFALLGVRTGSSREVAKQAQTAGKFSFRSWWDVPPAGSTESPIGGAWNVLGWPATYVIDGDGIIRFVDVRDEDLLKGVRQLLEAQADRDAAAARRR